MSGNIFGKLFTVTTCGESHGPALAAIIDGCPPGLALSEADIDFELNRRKTGSSPYTSQRREPDEIRILSGVFEGKTTGTPIGLVIENTNQKPRDYQAIKDKLRPGHADYTYLQKYGVRDYRGGGRSSARETVMRVAAGAIAKKYLRERYAIQIRGYLAQMGSIVAEKIDWDAVNHNPFFCPDVNKIIEMEKYIDTLRREGDSIGARVYIEACGVPPGWGDPVFDRLDATISAAMMSINAVKAVGIGAGFDCVTQRGSQHRDEMMQEGFLTNHAGGIVGGISSGQDIAVQIALKGASSIRIPGKTITTIGEPTEVVTTGRHDPCVGIRAVPIAEAMLALVLMDHCLRQRGQNADVTVNTPRVPAQINKESR